MNIQLSAPWRATKEEAMRDQAELKERFGLVHGIGYQHHNAGFEDGLNHKATATIELDNYDIEGRL